MSVYKLHLRYFLLIFFILLFYAFVPDFAFVECTPDIVDITKIAEVVPEINTPANPLPFDINTAPQSVASGPKGMDFDNVNWSDSQCDKICSCICPCLNCITM